nr:hypothetical protein CFP56_04129 [Quercus suber]
MLDLNNVTQPPTQVNASANWFTSHPTACGVSSYIFLRGGDSPLIGARHEPVRYCMSSEMSEGKSSRPPTVCVHMYHACLVTSTSVSSAFRLVHRRRLKASSAAVSYSNRPRSLGPMIPAFPVLL